MTNAFREIYANGVGCRANILSLSLAALLLAVPAAEAQYEFFDDMAEPEPMPFDISGGVGLTYLRANELVFNGNWTTSHLIWESKNVPTAFLRLHTGLIDQWTFTATVESGLSGDSHMVDFDWLAPHVVANGPDDWTDRSIHPDTRLDHFLRGSLKLGYDVEVNDALNVNLNGGFKYTDVKWTAYGGSYIYSVGGFRDSIGNFPDAQAGITYRQMLPVGFLGADAVAELGAFTLTAAAQGGLLVAGRTVDDHWVRNLRFIDYLNIAPVIAVSAEMEYAFSDQGSVFINGSFDKMFRTRGDTEVTNTTTGGVSNFGDSAGADFQSFSVAGGLKGNF